MTKNVKRFTLTITPEMQRSIEKLKQKELNGKTYPEIYRYILEKGILANLKKEHERGCQN